MMTRYFRRTGAPRPSPSNIMLTAPRNSVKKESCARVQVVIGLAVQGASSIHAIYFLIQRGALDVWVRYTNYPLFG